MLLDNSISQLHKLLKEKQVSCVDLVTEALKQINKYDHKLNSFISVRSKKELLIEAEEKDKKIDNNIPLLYGIPYSLKDCYVTNKIRTTCGNKILDDFNSPYQATIVDLLDKSGAILIGTNNLDAWGHGGSTENTDYNVAKNPWNTKHIPGGSSGGCAIAISTRMVVFAIGEDTGASIRTPSSMCNISGLKVTYGRVSRYGCIAYASSLDSVGPMAKTSDDLAIVLSTIAGHDSLDASSSKQNKPELANCLKNPPQKKTIGLIKQFTEAEINTEIKSSLSKVINEFRECGHEIIEVDLPTLQYGVSIYYLIALSETSSNLARYDGIRFGGQRELFSVETKRRIMLGTYALSKGYADKLYKKAQLARSLLIQEYDQAFKKCDVILAPITPSLPAIIGELINNPLKSFLEDLFACTVNVVGSPSLAIPIGFSKNKLPIGCQLIGPKFSEELLFQLAHEYQKNTFWHKEIPNLKNLT